MSSTTITLTIPDNPSAPVCERCACCGKRFQTFADWDDAHVPAFEGRVACLHEGCELRFPRFREMHAHLEVEHRGNPDPYGQSPLNIRSQTA